MSRLVQGIVLATATLAGAACMTSADVIAGRTWALDLVDGQPAVAPGTLTLATDGSLVVESGCNSGSGTYSIDGNQLRIEPIVLTAMPCLDDAVGHQEQQVLSVLAADPTFAVDTRTGQLRLVAGDSTLLFDAP